MPPPSTSTPTMRTRSRSKLRSWHTFVCVLPTAARVGLEVDALPTMEITSWILPPLPRPMSRDRNAARSTRVRCTCTKTAIVRRLMIRMMASTRNTASTIAMRPARRCRVVSIAIPMTTTRRMTGTGSRRKSMSNVRSGKSLRLMMMPTNGDWKAMMTRKRFSTTLDPTALPMVAPSTSVCTPTSPARTSPMKTVARRPTRRSP
mmetsp:Transcript_28630/g.51776  ORF Transcript_28630/g.51776 Transcript_28630/m.51776 type:complete len:204 (+) Transcript_28630:254-865(+)